MANRTYNQNVQLCKKHRFDRDILHNKQEMKNSCIEKQILDFNSKPGNEATRSHMGT